MDNVKLKTCQAENCNRQFQPYKTTDKYCSAQCAFENQPKKKKRPRIKVQKIKPVSDKRKREIARYNKVRIDFLNKHRTCPVTGLATTEIHHKKGRVGYADDWARENDVPLLVDTRFFLAVSRAGHERIEGNPEWAYDKGYSVLRTN